MKLINDEYAKKAAAIYLMGPLLISIMVLLSHIDGFEDLRMASFFYIIFMDNVSVYFVLPLISNSFLERSYEPLVMSLFFVLNIGWMTFLIYCIFGGLILKKTVCK